MTETRHVLCVDDNPVDRALIVRELNHAFDSVEVHEARCAEELEAALESSNFDLVVTDYQIRWTDGIRVLKTVKARDPFCPVIMFTGTGTEEVAVEAMKAGLDDYVLKNPHHFVRLRSAARAAFENAQAKRRMAELESRLESLLQRLHVGVFRCNADGVVLSANDAAQPLLGLQTDQPATAAPIPPALQHPRVRRAFEELARSGEPQDIEVCVAVGSGGASPNDGDSSGGPAPGTSRDTGDSSGDLKTHAAESRRARQSAQPPDTASDVQSRWLRISIAPAEPQQAEMLIDGLIEDISDRKRLEEEERRRAASAALVSRLSDRERQVLQLVVAGYPNKVIAPRLKVSEKTIEKHRAAIVRKLGVRSTPEAVRIAVEAGLPDHDPDAL